MQVTHSPFIRTDSSQAVSFTDMARMVVVGTAAAAAVAVAAVAGKGMAVVGTDWS